jgi:hypothetical protein
MKPPPLLGLSRHVVINAKFERSNIFSSYKVAPALHYVFVVECVIRKCGGCIIFYLGSIRPDERVWESLKTRMSRISLWSSTESSRETCSLSEQRFSYGLQQIVQLYWRGFSKTTRLWRQLRVCFAASWASIDMTIFLAAKQLCVTAHHRV